MTRNRGRAEIKCPVGNIDVCVCVCVSVQKSENYPELGFPSMIWQNVFFYKHKIKQNSTLMTMNHLMIIRYNSRITTSSLEELPKQLNGKLSGSN